MYNDVSQRDVYDEMDHSMGKSAKTDKYQKSKTWGGDQKSDDWIDAGIEKVCAVYWIVDASRW